MDIDEIRKRKMEEIQAQMNAQQNQGLQEEIQLQQQIQALENVLKQKLTKEALQRYGNLKIAHPEKAIQVLAIIGQNAKQINEINDSQFKELLKKMDGGKKDINIKRS